MIVWSGRGYLPILVFFISMLVLVSILPKEYGDYAFIVGFLEAAAVSWFLGKKWNSEVDKVVIDKATGQEYALKSNHTLFWIKLEYWGPIFLLFAIIILVQQFI